MAHSTEGYVNLLADLKMFEEQCGLDISSQELDYATGWSDFMRMSIYGGNPDVSEFGTTWISDFASMNNLHPFSASEIRSLGESEAFVPGVWKSGVTEGVVWAIPWLTDLSLVFYRRDWLAKAGVDEENAFATPEKFTETLQKLQDAGIKTPWVVPTQRSYITVHNLAMWIWSTGEDILDAEHKHVLFDRPKVRQAILAFFKLYKYLSPEARHLSEREADALFIGGSAAATISGPWAITNAVLQNDELRQNLGLAIPLGCSYTGGSSLILWQKSTNLQQALQLIQHLTSKEFQTVFPKSIGLLPGRLDALESFPLPNPSQYPLVMKALQTGRSLPSIGLWGLIEDRLAHALPNMWNDILSSPEPDLEALYDRHIIPLANRLNITMSQT